MGMKLSMPDGFLADFPNWILGSLLPAQGLAYFSPEKVYESLSTHYKRGPDFYGPGILIFDGMDLPEEYRTSEGAPLFDNPGIFEIIEEYEPIIIQGVHRTATAIETGQNMQYFILACQEHIDYLLSVVQGESQSPEGWNYTPDELRILPRNYMTVDRLRFPAALSKMQKEYSAHLEGWTMDDFVEELIERYD